MNDKEKTIIIIVIIIIVAFIVLSSNGGLSKIGKTCTQECINEERYCASTAQECVKKNFWGNCVEFESYCSDYETRCTQYGEVCR